MHRAVVVVLAVVALVTGCSQRSSVVSSSALAREPSASTAGQASARSMCADAFPNRVILGWMPATVGMLRAYQYGGPAAHLPLSGAFRGLSANARGAWCVVLAGRESSSLWALAPGRPPQRAITISGPGEGRLRGQLDVPPQVP